MLIPTIVALNGLFICHSSLALSYVNVAFAPSTVNPAPLAADGFAAPLATVIFKSSTSSVVLLIVVVVPSTCKSPLICNKPVASPIPAGSIINVLGPLSSPVSVMLFEICVSPVLGS